METLKKLVGILRQLSFPGKIISVIIITLVSVLIIFFNTGCALKFHADSMDNVTFDSNIKNIDK